MKLSGKQVLLYFFIGAFLFIAWRNPSGTSHEVGQFLGKTGDIAQTAVNKASTFLQNLAGAPKSTANGDNPSGTTKLPTVTTAPAG